MKISNLTKTSTEEIVQCLLKAFKNYFVPMPPDVSFWEKRFSNARVDKKLSWGVFDDGELVAFIVNGIDKDNGQLTAFNTGTGVVKKHRGKQLVDRMYEYGIPKLKENGITRCTLEVIDKNERAIKVYERIGFENKRRLKCYKGKLNEDKATAIKEVKVESLEKEGGDKIYSWDNKFKTLEKAQKTFKAYQVFDGEKNLGYFIINPINGYVAQLETEQEDWSGIFGGIKQITEEIRINNIDEKRQTLIQQLSLLGVENTIDQFEMEMLL